MSLNIKNIHEKLLMTVQSMLIDTKVGMPYYGEFNLHVNFNEQESIGTCAVNVTSKGMNFYFSPKFLENLSQKEVNFIVLHEDFHLLFDHPKRITAGQYDHKLANIAQDMIINHVIWEDISHDFVEIPKNKEGKNMTLFIPKEYKGKHIFEELYEWLKEEKDKRDKKKKEQNKCKSCSGTGEKQDQNGSGKKEEDKSGQSKGDKNQEGNGDSQEKESCPDCGGNGNEGGLDSAGNPSYGPYGKNPSKGNSKDGEDSIDTYSLDQIFQDMENNNGEYMDKHIGDDVPEDMREAMVKDVMDRLQSRGLTSNNVETTLNKLRKKRKDYLKEIKRSISNEIFGHIKNKTILRPNRRQISGIKGNRKIKSRINVILDTSGSMGGQGTFERVLNYVYRNDIEINFIESDTEIKWVERIKSAKKLESLPIKGLGGTIMQSGINHVVQNFNEYNTVLLTDGYTDSLDLSKLKGKLLIISVGVKVPIAITNNKVRQIVLDVTK